MAYEVPGFAYSMMSSGNITQFTAVRFDGADVATAAQNQNPIAGIAQMPAEAANPETIRIMQTGISFAVAAAQINAGENVVVSDDDGKLEPGDDHVVGVALTGAGADDELFALLLTQRSDTG